MDRFHRFVLTWPRCVITAVLIPWLFALGGLSRLEIATDGRALVPPESAAAHTVQDIEEEFGVGDELVLVVETQDVRGIWNSATLHCLADLSRRLADVEGVDPQRIQSLATERGDQVRPGTLDAISWLEPWPERDEDLELLRTRVERLELYRGTLIGFESPSRSAGIVFGLERGADRRATCAHLQRWLVEHTVPGVALYLVGAPLFESRLGDHLLADLALLVPLALLVMAAVLYWHFRAVWAVLLALMGVGFVVSTTFALMGWSNAPVYLTILVLPVVLTVVGVADAIHILGDYFVRVERDQGKSRSALLRETLARQWKPVLSAELTTALGFVSFAFSPLPPVRVFGMFATLGVALYVLWSLVLLPAGLVWLETHGLVTRRIDRSGVGRRWLSERCRALAALAQRRRWIVIAGLVVASAVCVHGIARLRVQDSWVEGFGRTSATYRDVQRFQASFGGVHILRIRVDARAAAGRGQVDRSEIDGISVRIPEIIQLSDRALSNHRLRLVPVAKTERGANSPGLDLTVIGSEPSAGGTRLLVGDPRLPHARIFDLLPQGIARFEYELSGADRLCAPEILESIGRFEAFLEGQQDMGVRRVLGPCAHLRTLSAMLGTDPAAHAHLLSTRDGIHEALDMYGRGRGPVRRSEVWNVNGDRALVTILVHDANFVSVGELMSRIRAFERDQLAPMGLGLAFGGDLALSQAMIDGIVRTEVGSLLGSVLGNAIVIALALVSLRWGLISALPCALAVMANFAFIGWTGLPLGVATSMFAAMTIGVGVDWAIHLVRAIRRNVDIGIDRNQATLDAYSEVGPTVIVDALSVGIGFGVMLLSSVPPTRTLGLLLSTSLLICLAATLLIIPALTVARGREPAP